MDRADNDYTVICRQWARAQRHAERAQREWHQAVQRLEREVMQLRGQLLALRTAQLWGIHAPALLLPRPRRTNQLPLSASARTALCHIGCHGHGHPWLDTSGHCRLHGGNCTSAAALDSDWPHPVGARDTKPCMTLVDLHATPETPRH
ncbi:hypothetical protein [Tepidimonas charontis]|uniref:Uncharacterized protein n=1 Tax=Tepidimonas charontis TaxID=2267262 RepID=A0A554XHD4_9BURK|nr:hypothetical protein [Tepidimonas charontis]TSE35245.1 hypothetical protein Tchar_00856 [Tepidimonas charontis]